MRVRYRRCVAHLVIRCMHEDERGDAHEGPVAVGALPIAAAVSFKGGRRGVSNVKGASIRRVCALVEPVAEAPPHILDINFAALLRLAHVASSSDVPSENVPAGFP